MKCPSCKSTNLQRKGMRAGKQRYRCKDCEANFTEGVPYIRQTQLPPVSGVICPRCGRSSIIRDGKLEDGSQRFKCLDCRLSFSTKTPKRVTPEEEFNIIKAILIGKNVKKVVSNYDCTTTFVEELMAPYYAAETVTPKQKQDIIKYGYYLRVPVDYMAEYIKCSEHKCEEVLKKFKRSVKSTSRGAI